MRKLISNVLIALALVLVLVPSIKSQKEINESKQLVEDVKSNKIKLDTGGYILNIDKINLEMPVKNGATNKNMVASVATITHNLVEDGQNFTLAGHRNIRSGKNFNRLDELDKGDLIEVFNQDNIYKYKVTDKLIVKPNKGDVLRDRDKTEITLVTCHPIGISSHRLIIKGELINE